MDSERAQANRDECDRWLAVLKDLGDLNMTSEVLADDLADATVALLTLISLTDARANEFVRDGMNATNRALGRIMGFQTSLVAILRKAEERAEALRAELVA